MCKCVNTVRLFALLVAGIFLPGGSPRAQDNSYRLTPPLRLAARPTAGDTGVTVDKADHYRPRDPRSKPATVAAQGYCLVDLRDQREWVPGLPKIQAIRGDKVYLFASERARDIFLAAPEPYLPVLDGDCLVTFAETGERRTGQLQWSLIYQQRLYFFANEEQRRKFQSQPQFYIDADLVDGGLCIVSKIEQNRTVSGLPETVAIVDGRRYFFASAFHRKLFVSRPDHYIGDRKSTHNAGIKVEVPTEDNITSDIRAFGDVTSQSPGGTSPVALMSKPDKKSRSAKKANQRDDAGEQIENRAMAGYCPVTIRTQGLWQRGKSKFKSTFDDKAYYMLGPEELSAFQANPREFMPVLGGDSVVSFVNDYERVPGSVFNAVQYKGRLYLFTDTQQKKTFSQQPALFENADLANGGNCVVSQIEEKKEVSGSTDFETVHRGMRYRFASEEYLKKFKADRKVYTEE